MMSDQDISPLLGKPFLDSHETRILLDKASLILVSISDFGIARGYGKFPYFKVHALICEGGKILLAPVNATYSPYWDKDKEAYKMAVWGTPRIWELLYSLSMGDIEKAQDWASKLKVLFL